MTHAIILAAGSGSRLKTDKMLIEVAGHPLIYYTISALHDHPEISEITIAASSKNREAIKTIVKKYNFRKVTKVILGGSTRQESLKKALKHSSTQITLVHNGANPLPSQQEITAVIKAAETYDAAISAHPLKSTTKEVKRTRIQKTIDRKNLYAAETPQAAKTALLKKALTQNTEATDESMLLEAIGIKPKVINAHENNFKITTPRDLETLRAILGDTPKDFLVGIGQDSHSFDKSKPLALAGLEIPDHPGFKANSDGDVILHAISRAILQALGEGSFSAVADPMCQKGIADSKKYLAKILTKLKGRKFTLNSLGLQLECQTPQIDPLKTQLKQNLSKLLSLAPEKIGITATSGEYLTPFGKGQAIQCFAIISLKSTPDA